MNYDKDSLLKYEVLRDPQKVSEAIAAGADVNALSRFGRRTPLYLIVNPETGLLLLQAGADWTIEDSNGHTAEQWHQQRLSYPLAEVIERWAAVHERSASLNENLDTANEQWGPGL